MKTVSIIVGVIAVAAIALFGFYMIDIDQTQEARLPDVNVEVEEGQLPEFDADVGSISVGSTEVEVTVPEVEVSTSETSFSVPVLDVEAPEEDNAADN